MLLVVDVGNTHITLGVFDGETVKATFRTTAKQPRTSDEYGIQLCDLLEHRGFDIKEIQDVIISSVVPDVMHSLSSAIIKYFHVKPIIPTTLEMGLKINTEHPKEIGPDRIVDAVAAYELYGGPILVIDFGTATTYDVVSENGVFEGGLISTGIRTAARALWGGAAMLPELGGQGLHGPLGQTTGHFKGGGHPQGADHGDHKAEGGAALAAGQGGAGLHRCGGQVDGIVVFQRHLRAQRLQAAGGGGDVAG